MILFIATGAPTNLAEGKRTSVTSTARGDHVSSVDGFRNATYSGIFGALMCEGCWASEYKPNQWWRVDLGSSYFITRVNIYTGNCYFLLYRYLTSS